MDACMQRWMDIIHTFTLFLFLQTHLYAQENQTDQALQGYQGFPFHQGHPHHLVDMAQLAVKLEFCFQANLSDLETLEGKGWRKRGMNDKR